MLLFLKRFGTVVCLFVAGTILAVSAPDIGLWLGLAFLIIPIIAIFKPIPQIKLDSRLFSASIALCVGGMTTLVAVGTNAERGQLAALRENNPTEYLAKIEETNPQKWLEELRVLEPSRYEAELARIAAEDAQRRADDAAAEELRLAEAAAEKERRDAVAAQANADRVAQAAEERRIREAEEAAAHIEVLEREIASIPGISISKYTGSIGDINTGLILLGTWGLLYEQGADLTLGPEGDARRDVFRRLLLEKQAQMLPAMRDGFGPAMRQQLWEADGHAQTVGGGFRTIKIAAPDFVRNANIASVHGELRDQLLMLRFTRAEYRWYRQAREYSYYTLEGPSDRDIVVWDDGGRYRIVQ